MKKTIDIAFVILHYKTDEQTENCINSIIKNISQRYIITVVDNFSNNRSVEKLENKFNKNNNVIFIKSEKNLGFAKGNNLGISWVNEHYNTNYIAVINNDTQLLDNKFYNIIDGEYKKSGFSVMGPKVILLNEKINPIYAKNVTLEKALKRKKRLIRQIIIRILHLEKIVETYKGQLIKRRKKDNILNPNNYYRDVVLHGCFLIFSKDYFKHYNGFDNRTFLYLEEELLFTRIKKANLVSVYNPKLVIFHEEDVSTNFSIPNERKRALFKLKNIYKSNNILIKELKEMEEIK